MPAPRPEPSETPSKGGIIFGTSLRPRYLPVTDPVDITLDLGQFLPKEATPMDVLVRLNDLDPVLEPEFSELFMDQSFAMKGSVLTQPIDGELKAGMGVLLTVAGTCSTGSRFMASVTFITRVDDLPTQRLLTSRRRTYGWERKPT